MTSNPSNLPQDDFHHVRVAGSLFDQIADHATRFAETLEATFLRTRFPEVSFLTF